MLYTSCADRRSAIIRFFPEMKRIIIFLIMFTAGASFCCRGQNVAVKTNLLADGFLCPNIGIEAGLAPRWTLDMEGQLNLWTLPDKRHWKHWAVQPEARYWFCDRFSGHFVGAHVHGGKYNMGGFDGKVHFLGTDARKLKDTRYQGWFAGLGVSYGYAWILGRHWNLEAELGLGYSYTRYDRFRCETCGRKLEENVPHHYVGPTRLAVNLVYLF